MPSMRLGVNELWMTPSRPKWSMAAAAMSWPVRTKKIALPSPILGAEKAIAVAQARDAGEGSQLH